MSAILQDISEKLQKGKMKEVAELVKQAVADGIQPLTILNEGLMPGMDIIGERFKKNDIFIPEVLIAARAMAAGTDVLRPLLVGDQMEEKNLVRMMMESKGLNVIDLGNSVPPAKYIEAAAKHNADIIACSALLTTTMVHIKDVVKGVAESPLAGKVKIMIGGAPDWTVWALCVVFTLLWARIAAVFANRAQPKTLNRATGIILVVLGIVVMLFSLLS